MKKRIVFGAFAATVAVFLGAAGMAFAQVPVTECGQWIFRGQTGELVGDLDCSAFEDNGVTLDTGARLFLNGFTLTGRYQTSTSLAVVRCLRRCRIEGPGTITGGNYGVRGEPPRGYGVRWQTNIKIRGTTISGNGAGVTGHRVKVEGSTITNNLGGYGVLGFIVVKVEGSTITNNLFGIGGRRSTRIKESTVGNNDFSGVISFGGALIKDSVIVDNGLDPDCPAENALRCADVVLGKAPRLVGTTTCGTSLNLSAQGWGCYETWGVCAEDPELGLCPQL